MRMPQQESQTALCRGLFLGTETTKTKREQPKQRREWQYNAEKHKGKASASRVLSTFIKETNFQFTCTKESTILSVWHLLPFF